MLKWFASNSDDVWAYAAVGITLLLPIVVIVSFALAVLSARRSDGDRAVLCFFIGLGTAVANVLWHSFFAPWEVG